jgi:large subunit ribosomal protein L15
MQLHELGHKKQYGKRIARGGKRGKTSGRGQKGQKSRAGTSMRPALRDLISRIPKRRGFANKPSSPKAHVVNVGLLAKHATGKAEITVTTLKELKLVPNRFRGPVKILGFGSVTTALKLSGLEVSDSARAKIEATGGSIA